MQNKQIIISKIYYIQLFKNSCTYKNTTFYLYVILNCKRKMMKRVEKFHACHHQSPKELWSSLPKAAYIWQLFLGVTGHFAYKHQIPARCFRNLSFRLRSRLVSVLCTCSVLLSWWVFAPTVLQSSLWPAWDKTLTRHFAMQQACACNHKVLGVHMYGKHVA